MHHAYDNNFVGAATSQLRAIDIDLQILVTQANNAGTLQTIGPLGAKPTSTGGFDVSASGNAYATFATVLPAEGNTSSLYSVDLSTGSLTFLGDVPGTVAGMAVVPEPVSLMTWSLVLPGIYVLRRRFNA